MIRWWGIGASWRRGSGPVPDPSIRRSKHPLGCPAVSYASSVTHREIMGLVQALLRCEVSNPG